MKPYHTPMVPAQAAPKKPAKSRTKAASGRPAVTPSAPRQGVSRPSPGHPRPTLPAPSKGSALRRMALDAAFGAAVLGGLVWGFLAVLEGG